MLFTVGAALVSSAVEVDLVVRLFEFISTYRFGGANQLCMSTRFPEHFQSSPRDLGSRQAALAEHVPARFFDLSG